MDASETCEVSVLHTHSDSTAALGIWKPEAQRRFPPSLVIVGMQMVDIAILLLTVVILYRSRAGVVDVEGGQIIVSGGAACAMTSYCLASGGAYRLDRHFRVAWQMGLLFVSVVTGMAMFALSLEVLHKSDGEMTVAFMWAALALIILSAARGVWTPILRAWKASGIMARRIAIVGVNKFTQTFVERAASPDFGLRIVGLYTDKRLDEWEPTHNSLVQGNLEDLAERSRLGVIDTIVLSVSSTDNALIGRLRNAVCSKSVEIFVPLGKVTQGVSRDDICVLGGTPMIRVCRRPLGEWQQIKKAVFDRVMGAFLLVATLPVLLVVAAAIRMESPGPVLFRQQRIGLNNQTFTIYKFRTMFNHNDQASLSGAKQARRGDPRITRVGRLLRKLSIDELPQLVNVIKGEMSLVGPRPHPLETRAAGRLFQDVVANYAMRHRVQPGITGWAQVNGWRGETVTADQIEQRVAHDLHYIDNWSMWLDIQIILRTLITEVSSKIAF